MMHRTSGDRSRAPARSRASQADSARSLPGGAPGSRADVFTPGSFDELFCARFDELFRSLFRYLDRLTGDAELASDIAQEALTRLYERRAMPDDVRAWLVTVANNRLRSHAQQARRRRWLLALRSDAVPRPVDAPAPDAFAEREGMAWARDALVRLVPRDREMLLLRMEGYSYREIAGALGLVETSVGTLLSRAKAAFVHALGEGRRASD